MLRLVVFLSQIYFTYTADILAVIPTASYSHQIPFQPLWTELSKRGHKVTVLTSDPQPDVSLNNLKEIDISYIYKIYDKYNLIEVLIGQGKSALEIVNSLRKTIYESNEAILKSPEVQELIHNKHLHFDLVMVEAQLPHMLAFGWRFQCPTIGIASMDSTMQYHDSMGNLVHPVIAPDCNLPSEDFENPTFKERLISFIYTIAYKYYMYNMAQPRYREQAKRFFGKDLPPLVDLQNNVSMLFVGTHPLFHPLRPSNLNTLSLGTGMHIRKPKKLPQDIQKFLDDSKEGVVYFSLGSNLKGSILSDTWRATILQAFSEIKYKVLIKIDGNIKNVPKNVKIQSWMPQQDILRHPNIKLFVTQGGLQSLQESITNGVPLVGIPFYGDQFLNVNGMVKRGYGIKLDRKQLTKEALKTAIIEVIENPKYRKKAQEMREIFRDEEIPSLKRAVYWTEYVIRHKGAKHLRSPVVDMPFWKYYMMDILGLLITCVLGLLFVAYAILKFIFKLLYRLLFRRYCKKNHEE